MGHPWIKELAAPDESLGDAQTNLKKSKSDETRVVVLTAVPVARMALAAQD